jgi:hypothetical protein
VCEIIEIDDYDPSSCHLLPPGKAGAMKLNHLTVRHTTRSSLRLSAGVNCA